MNNNINIIKDKKIKNYENYINKTITIFKDILNKINIIHNNLKMKNNSKLTAIINDYYLNIDNLNINDISNIINEELDNINEKIYNNKINNENKIYNENKFNNENKINNKNNNENKINKEMKLNNENKLNEYRNKINLIYYSRKKSICHIFGDKFVNNNKNNIELKIMEKIMNQLMNMN